MVELVDRGHDRHEREPRGAGDHAEELDGAEPALPDLPGERDHRQRSEDRGDDERDVHDRVARRHLPLTQVVAEERVDDREERQLEDAEPSPSAAGEDAADTDELRDGTEVVAKDVHGAMPPADTRVRTKTRATSANQDCAEFGASANRSRLIPGGLRGGRFNIASRASRHATELGDSRTVRALL